MLVFDAVEVLPRECPEMTNLHCLMTKLVNATAVIFVNGLYVWIGYMLSYTWRIIQVLIDQFSMQHIDASFPFYHYNIRPNEMKKRSYKRDLVSWKHKYFML